MGSEMALFSGSRAKLATGRQKGEALGQYPILDIKLPDFDGHHPFSQGERPDFYSPERLGDFDPGKTIRTHFFEKYLAAIYWKLDGPVPYVFRTSDGATRSLDAGCLGFLAHRTPPEIEFGLDERGEIATVRPTGKLLDRYAPLRERLLRDISPRQPAAVSSAPALIAEEASRAEGSTWSRYAEAWPLLARWDEARGGPRPAVRHIEDAILLMTKPGDPDHVLNKGLRALSVGFRPDGSTAAQRAYASMTDSPYNNVGKLGDALREAYGTSDLQPGQVYRLVMPGGVVSVTSKDRGHVQLAMLERFHPASKYAGAEGILDTAQLSSATVLQDVAEAGTELAGLADTERETLIKARLGQGQFRADLIAYWGGCAITGLSFAGMLRASHIKPWCKSSNKERLDKFNGLLLTPNLDQAFDAGLITFDDDGSLLISPLLDAGAADALGIVAGTKLKMLEAAHQPYLAWHRENLFRAR
jgi:hypothetical protein